MGKKTEQEKMERGPRITRELFKVIFSTFMPWEQRQAAQGQYSAHEKVVMYCLLWAPIPIDHNGKPAPEKLPPEEQGALWAQNEVIRMKPDGREILSILAVQAMDLREDQIANQPKRSDEEQEEDPKPAQPSLIVPAT